MKLKEKISWLMGRVQGSLFPHLNECMDTVLTEQEQRQLVALKRPDSQFSQSAAEAIRELPAICDRGTKKNAKGYKTLERLQATSGHKTMRACRPTLVASASVHDSQAAIPLITLTSNKSY